MKPIKILHLISTVEDGKGIGGAEKLLLSMLDKIDKSKFEFIFAYYLPSRLKKEFKRTKVEQLFRDKGVEIELFITRSKFDVLAIINLIKIIKAKNIDIIHAHQPRLDFLASITAMLFGIPAVVTRHLSIARFPINQLRKQIYQLVDRLVTTKLVNKIITVSKEIADDLVKMEKVKPDKVKVIYNGIDPEEFSRQADGKNSIRKEFNLDGCPLVGIIARINVQKGHKYFLEAVSYITKVMTQVKFLIVGDGPLMIDQERMAKEMGITPWIIFTGYRADISQIISELDIIVLSSLTEGLPVIILEAMAHSKPVISFNVGGLSELISNGQEGILVTPKDSNALAESIIKVLKDAHLADKIAKGGFIKVSGEFNINRMVEKYQDVYQQLIKETNDKEK